MYESVICPSKIIKSNFRKINKSRILDVVCVTSSEVFFVVSGYVSILLLQRCIFYTTHAISVSPIEETFKQLHHLLKHEKNSMSQICELCLQDGEPLFSFLRLSGSFIVCLWPVFESESSCYFLVCSCL